jgi:hypothetical protein
MSWRDLVDKRAPDGNDEGGNSGGDGADNSADNTRRHATDHGRENTRAAAAAAARLKRGSRYRLTGEGDTFAISVVTVIVLFGLWWCATRFGWIKPLFLPSPTVTFNACVDALQGNTQGQAPLIDHVLVSIMRVLARFSWPCSRQCRWESPWAHHASRAALPIRSSSFTGRCRRWRICR